MRPHVLAVGQADALILELPSGRLAVVDFGHDLLLDYLAALDRTGTRRFAFCLLTHAHHDHYACLEEFICHYDAQVDEYWFSFADTSHLPPLLALRLCLPGRTMSGAPAWNWWARARWSHAARRGMRWVWQLPA